MAKVSFGQRRRETEERAASKRETEAALQQAALPCYGKGQTVLYAYFKFPLTKIVSFT